MPGAPGLLTLGRMLPEAAWDRTCTAGGNTLSVRTIASVLVGHCAHHLDIIAQPVAQGT